MGTIIRSWHSANDVTRFAENVTAKQIEELTQELTQFTDPFSFDVLGTRMVAAIRAIEQGKMANPVTSQRAIGLRRVAILAPLFRSNTPEITALFFSALYLNRQPRKEPHLLARVRLVLAENTQYENELSNPIELVRRVGRSQQFWRGIENEEEIIRLAAEITSLSNPHSTKLTGVDATEKREAAAPFLRKVDRDLAHQLLNWLKENQSLFPFDIEGEETLKKIEGSETFKKGAIGLRRVTVLLPLLNALYQCTGMDPLLRAILSVALYPDSIRWVDPIERGELQLLAQKATDCWNELASIVDDRLELLGWLLSANDPRERLTQECDEV